MDFRSFLAKSLVRLDGGMGSLLQERGLAPGEPPELFCLSHPELVTDIHRAYLLAGSHVVSANTFGVNPLKYDSAMLSRLVHAAVECARRACREADGEGPRFVALDIGPLGKLLRPLGELAFSDAVALFAETVRAGVQAGVDLIFIETMNDAYETKAAVLAAKENSTLPLLVSNAYGEDGKLLTGATPEAMVALLEGMGVDAIGANCSLGPRALSGVAEAMLAAASVPVLLKPNAGLPRVRDGATVYDVLPEEFSLELADLARRGVRLVGGCCGTTPRYIEALTEKTKAITPVPIVKKEETVVSSYTHAVSFGGAPLLIGERINPTGKKRFREALVSHDISYILGEAVREEEAGVQLLDVNVGLPELDEVSMLAETVTELQAVTALPLCLDTASPEAMEAALRIYNGKPLINSVNGKQESLRAVLPLVKKYGGVVIALTLDEDGIPDTAEGRVAIARRILAAAEAYGIEKKNIVFDPLALTVSADSRSALTTLAACEGIRRELGCHTLLGVSNISFGLPCRDIINATFFAMALTRGLSAAIMNPYSQDMMRTFRSFLALTAHDEGCAAYIASIPALTKEEPRLPCVTAAPATGEDTVGSALSRAIRKGLRSEARDTAAAMLAECAPLALIDEEIVPALNAVGRDYEEGRVYLPSLLMSAEAAGEALLPIKAALSEGAATAASRGTVVLATVQGDIHDIGKNIVRLLLESYGFSVIDLGKDVPPNAVLAAVREKNAPLLGLSALMTTTVPSMADTIALVKREAPSCRILVGGAVLTADYAAAIGADAYAADAMAAVHAAKRLLSEGRG